MNSDNPKDPIAEKLTRAREGKKADSDAAEGERQLAADFQRQANQNGPGEVAKIEAMFAARCEHINADKSADDPKFQYNNTTHELRAGNFATYLELTQGFSPHRLDMVSGLRRDAPRCLPPVSRLNMKQRIGCSWHVWMRAGSTGNVMVVA